MSGAPAAVATRVLVDVHVAALAVAVAPDAPARVRLPVDESDARDRVVVIVRVLISTLDQLLLGLLEAERADKSLAVARDVDVGHVARVIHSRLPLLVVRALVVVAALIHGLLATAVKRLLPVALVDRIQNTLAVQVGLA